MSVDRPWRDRRDNGLVAEEYAMVGDVDRDTGERVLISLAAEGIAAYLQFTDSSSEVSDLLFADARSPETARAHLTREKFSSIVSNIPEWGDPGHLNWPPSESGQHENITPRRRRTDKNPPINDRESIDNTLPLPFDDDGFPDVDDEEDGYTPPPPPALPTPSGITVLASLSIIGGIALFLWPHLLPISPNIALALGFLGIVGGFITLVWRLNPGDGDDPDDGARV